MIHDCHALAVLCPTLAVLLPCYCRADGNYYCCAAWPLPGNCCRAAWQLHGNLRCNCTAPRWLPRWLPCAGYAGCHATAMPHCSCCRAVATLHGYRSSCHALATHAPRSRGRRARERRRLRSFGGLLASSGAEKAKISYRFSGAREASLVLGPSWRPSGTRGGGPRLPPPSGPSKWPVGPLLGRSWAHLGRSWGRLGVLLGLSWAVLGGTILERSWVARGASRAAVELFQLDLGQLSSA